MKLLNMEGRHQAQFKKHIILCSLALICVTVLNTAPYSGRKGDKLTIKSNHKCYPMICIVIPSISQHISYNALE